MRHCSLCTVLVVLAVSACSPSTPSTPTSSKAKSDDEGKRYPPCHPGCFPAGTLVATPAGPRPIEAIRPGDAVTLIAPDGGPTSGTVDTCFQTDNRLVEVQTEAGNLLTTETQPLCLQPGGFRPAGELAAGDVIWRWEAGVRRPTRVRAVAATGREAAVFNLVVGDGAVFVAGGFLARGKPPAPSGAAPAQAD